MSGETTTADASESPAAATPTASLTVGALLASLAAETPAPGGGSVSALAGALGAALGAMVCRLSAAREAPGMAAGRAEALTAELDDLRRRLLAGFDVDQQAYEGILRALRLPRQTEAEKATRRKAVAAATRHATLVPLENARLCVRVLEVCEVVVAVGLPQAVTDAGVGAAIAYAGVQGAVYNVLVNLGGLDDPAFVATVRSEAAALLDAAEAARGRADAAVRRAIGA
jgi:formiminotetrahydrofolate cyclodeaminase